MMRTTRTCSVTLGLALLCSASLLAQTATAPAPGAAAAGTVERIKVHGRALEGNLLGDSPDRDVAVYLPASYKTAKNRRYPVLYMLHGYTDDIDHWWGFVKHFVSVPASMNKALAAGVAKEMILVMPNAYTRYQGSFYSSSPATGNWEEFVSRELVSYIDKHYRTIADVNSRGLVGHSMGGYGAVRIAMRHPDVFSTLYAMSSCCLTPYSAPSPERAAKMEAITTPDEVTKLDFGTKAMFALAAAWSPNPSKAPLFIDLPTKDGQAREEIVAKWTANSPVAMIDQYIGHLKRLRAIAIDVGTKDGLAPGSRRLHEALTLYQIAHQYETYEGDHVNKVAERLETKVFPFFSKHLSATAPSSR